MSKAVKTNVSGMSSDRLKLPNHWLKKLPVSDVSVCETNRGT